MLYFLSTMHWAEYADIPTVARRLPNEFSYQLFVKLQLPSSKLDIDSKTAVLETAMF